MDDWDRRAERRGPRLRFVRPEGAAPPPNAYTSPPTRSESPARAERDERLGRRGLVAHAAWVPPLGEGQSQLALWAEAETDWPVRRRDASTAAPDRARSHPFSARHLELMNLLERLWRTARPGVRPRSASTPARLQLWLPASATRPLPTPELVRAGWAPDPALDPARDASSAGDLAAATLATWRVDGLLLDAESAGTLLAGLPHHPGAEIVATSAANASAAPRLLMGSDLRLWSAAGQFVFDLLVRQRYLPGATRLPDLPTYGYSYSYQHAYSPGPRIASLWFASFSDPTDRARFEALAAAMPDLCRAVLTPGATNATPNAVPAPAALLEDFAHTVINARIERWLVQSQVTLNLGEPQSPGGTYTSPYDNTFGYGYAGSSSLAARWLWGLMTPNRPLYVSPAEAQRLLTSAQRWHAGLGGAGQGAFRLCFRLTPPEGWDDAEPATGTAQGTDGADGADGADGLASPPLPTLPRLIAEPALDGANGHHPPTELDGDPNHTATTLAMQEPLQTLDASGRWSLQYLLQARDDLSLLVPLDEVWREGGAVARFLDRRFEHPHEQVLASLGQAARLFAPIDASLREAHPLGCLLTGAEAYAFLREALPLLEEAGFGVLVPSWWKRAPARPTMRLRLKGMRKTSTGLMGLDAVMDYDWKLALGGEELTREELERLAALKEPLVRLRGQWVELRPDQVDAALRFMATHNTGKMSMGEALGAALTGQVGDEDVEIEEVSADAWIGDLLSRLRGGDTLAEVPTPGTLHGTLRPYQQRGLSWLSFLTRYGLGACLADDMGLGKCELPGSRVSTLAGPVSVETFWERQLTATESDDEGGEWGTLAQPVLVNTFDGREIKATPVRHVYRQNIAEECVEVELGDGARLSSTRRHRYLTPGGWKMAGELAVGDLVGVPACTPHVGTNEMLPELAELMAWQMAEGVEHTKFHAGMFFNADQVVMERFRGLAAKLGRPLVDARQCKTSLCVSSGLLFYLFEPWGYEWGHKSATKVIPQSVLEAPLESQRAFIAAMIDAEGHVSKTHCEFVSASHSIMYGMRDMLRHFGIWMRIRVAMKAATNGSGIKRPYYVGTFGGNSVTRFAEHFRLLTPRKQEALERLAALTRNSNVEGVPTQAVVAAIQERCIPLRSVGLRTVYEWQGMGRPLAASVATQLRDRGYADLAEQIDDLSAPGVYWCKVKDVSRFPYDGYVYDLEVPETHNYVANGIITHNTVQLLALMLHQKSQGALNKPVLLICPTSVVGNWRHETARFAPDLRVLVHHGAGRVGRAAAARFTAEVANYDLVITTYSLLPRDEETLAKAEWGAVVLDEAQNIKNAEAKQSRAARKLKAPVRVALTGTPVENRLAELWSIMDFLNGGYLGSHKRFHERFAFPVEKERDPAATARLQALVRPFVLRRLKTDPTVISDLPDKIEVKEYCPLTREQVTLYEAVVRDGLRQIEEAEGDMKRRGVVLGMLSKLKQVCNHPAHFLGDGSALEGRSGKLIRLEELIEELLAEGDRALIFTQFTAMGDRLQPYLQQRFGSEVLYLHGSVPRQQRDRMVARFQEEDGPPLFLLSLKAGGTGLNLTRANHVIHFDRWWNPAVENQATDRAFRIGQTRNVQVRKFVCTGTLEERIDAMIEQKRELAENVIGTGEGWITEMSTTELRELFSLRSEALAE